MGNIVKSQEEGLKIYMEELMTFCLTPIPYSIRTADGYLAMDFYLGKLVPVTLRRQLFLWMSDSGAHVKYDFSKLFHES